MRNTIRFGLSIALGCLAANVSGAAEAGDLPTTVPAKTTVLQPAPDWSGFFVGLGAGFRSTRTDSAVTSITQNGVDVLAGCAALAALGGCGTGEPLNDTAFRLNPYIGANLQIAARWVVGVEADWGFAEKSTTLRGMGYPATFGQ